MEAANNTRLVPIKRTHRRSSALMKTMPHVLAIRMLAVAAVFWTGRSAAATFVWDGGDDGVDLGKANNWNPNGSPVANDVLQWNGTVAGNLSLAYTTLNAGLNTNPGVSLSITAGQVGNLTIDGGTNALRLNGSGIGIASGSGAFSLGDGAGTTNITAFNGTMNLTNNSSNAATIASDVVFATTFGGNTTFNFAGSGNWNVNTNLRSTNNVGGNVANVTGTGTVFMNAANTYTGGTNLNVTGGNSRIRATANGALGTGTVFIAGNSGSNRLEVEGGITLNNALAVNGKENFVGAAAAILNVSGNNTLGGTVTLNVGGSDSTIRSDQGRLTLSAATAITHGASGSRGLLFTGDGDITVSGNIAQGGATLAIYKQGSGTLTLSGSSNTYTGATTVSAGTLLVNGSLGNTAVDVTGGILGGSGSIAGAVSVSATLMPGTSIESLSTGSLTMASGSSYVFEIADNSSTGADLVAVNGTLSLTGVDLDFDTATLAALASGSWSFGNKITLISYLGTGVTSGFTGYADDSPYLFGSNQWIFNYNDTLAGNNFATDAVNSGQNRFVTMTFIPEPSAAFLAGLGLLTLLCRRR